MKESIKFEIKHRKSSIKIVNWDSQKHEVHDEIIVSTQGRNLHTGKMEND